MILIKDISHLIAKKNSLLVWVLYLARLSRGRRRGSSWWVTGHHRSWGRSTSPPGPGQHEHHGGGQEPGLTWSGGGGGLRLDSWHVCSRRGLFCYYTSLCLYLSFLCSIREFTDKHHHVMDCKEIAVHYHRLGSWLTTCRLKRDDLINTW